MNYFVIIYDETKKVHIDMFACDTKEEALAVYDKHKEGEFKVTVEDDTRDSTYVEIIASNRD